MKIILYANLTTCWNLHDSAVQVDLVYKVGNWNCNELGKFRQIELLFLGNKGSTETYDITLNKSYTVSSYKLKNQVLQKILLSFSFGQFPIQQGSYSKLLTNCCSSFLKTSQLQWKPRNFVFEVKFSTPSSLMIDWFGDDFEMSFSVIS